MWRPVAAHYISTMLTLSLILATQLAATDDVAATLERLEATRARYLDGPRVRFGIGTWATGGIYPQPSGGVVGLSVHAGVQLNDRVAFYLLAQGSTALLWSALMAGAMAEYSPAGWFAVAMGAGLSGGYELGRGGGFGYFGGPPSGGGSPDSLTVALGAPVRLTLSFGPSQPDRARRHRFFIAIDGFAGAQVGNRRAGVDPLAVSGGLSIGYQMM